LFRTFLFDRASTSAMNTACGTTGRRAVKRAKSLVEGSVDSVNDTYVAFETPALQAGSRPSLPVL
jgi:hypothetical protein